MKKLLSLLVVCSLILSAFTVISVSAANDNLIPLVGRLDMDEDFSGTSYDSRIEPQIYPDGSEGSATITDGELKISSVTSTVTGAYVYVNADKTGITSGEYVTQFKLTRPDTLPKLLIRISSQQDKSILAYDWGNTTGEGKIRYSNNKGVDETGNKTYKANDSKTSIVVTMKIDIDDMKFWLWFDSTLAVAGKYPSQAIATNLAKVRFYTEAAGVSFSVDDIKLYAPMTDAEAVQKDFDALTFDSLFAGSVLSDNILKKDVDLYTTGANRSTITWASTNEKYINTKGNVTFADTLEAANPEVTLTATVALGEVSMTKSFVLKVAKENEVFDYIPKYKNMHYQNEFATNNITDANYVLTQNGGTVTIADNSLNITRTENVGATVADVYLDGDKTPRTGNIYASFVMRKEGTGKVIGKIQSENIKDYVMITWASDGVVTIKGRDSLSADEKNYNVGTYTDTELRINVLLNTGGKFYSLWINGENVLPKKYARFTDVECSFTNFRFYLEGTDFITATVDDIKVYSEKTMTDGITVSEDNKTASYVFYNGVPEDCKNTAMIIAVYDSPNELADIQIGYLNGNVATASVSELKSGQTVKYMAFKDMENIVPLVKSIEKTIE